jgi:hypothetical protein
MRRLRVVAVAFVVTATAPLTSCDRQSPTRATPIQQPPPPNTSATGEWRGTMGEPSYDLYIEGHSFWITLTQTDSRLEGTLHCGGACLYSAMRVSGTVSGTIPDLKISLRGDYPFGNCTLQGEMYPYRDIMVGNYSCFQEVGIWDLWRQSTTMPEPCVPDLVLPPPGAALDNGRTDFRDPIEWNFDWTDCATADEHSIAILGPGASRPSVFYSRDSSYARAECGVYLAEHNRFNWRFWVRSRVGNYWGAWSPAHTFEVERPDSDPMSPRCPAR